jgi:hypothetical protein
VRLARSCLRLVRLTSTLIGWLGSSIGLTTLGVVLFLAEPSYLRCALFVGLLFLQCGLFYCYCHVSDLMHIGAARRHFLRITQNYSFTRIAPNDPIVLAGHYRPDGRDRLAIVRRAIRDLHGKGIDSILIYRGSASSGATVYPACASYPGINVPSIVLVFDDPSRTPIARFRLYHELAHVGWLAPFSASYRLSLDPFIVLVILSLCTSGLSVSLAALYAVCRVLSLSVGYATLQEELVADRIALHQIGKCLGAEAVARVLQMLDRGATAAILFSGYRAGLAHTRARFARAYSKAISTPPGATIPPRKVEGAIGLAAMFHAAFSDGSLVRLSWTGVGGVWLLAILVLGLGALLFGFVLGSGQRLKYDQHIDF